MTAKELSQLRWLKREIEDTRKRLAALEAAARGATNAATGLPRACGKADGAAAAAMTDAIADVRAILQARTTAAAAEYVRLNRYIAGVDDSLMRQILSLRYIDDLSWPMVAARIGGGNTEDGVRKAHNRYLKTH